MVVSVLGATSLRVLLPLLPLLSLLPTSRVPSLIQAPQIPAVFFFLAIGRLSPFSWLHMSLSLVFSPSLFGHEEQRRNEWKSGEGEGNWRQGRGTMGGG